MVWVRLVLVLVLVLACAGCGVGVGGACAGCLVLVEGGVEVDDVALVEGRRQLAQLRQTVPARHTHALVRVTTDQSPSAQVKPMASSQTTPMPAPRLR